jgi:putative SOS response-associated peptidase YedK
MAMAGLYFADTKGKAAQFVILTTPADGSLHDLHHRCPLVLPATNWSNWLKWQYGAGRKLFGASIR